MRYVIKCDQRDCAINEPGRSYEYQDAVEAAQTHRIHTVHYAIKVPKEEVSQ